MIADTVNDHGPTSVVLVANRVGGLGGMERQLERLVRGLLERDWTVTVIAWCCDMPPHERLRFVRARLPQRPFCVAYPAFFVVASLLARRHKAQILHATGAIIANRVDVATVHYCHEAAARVLATPRRSRSSVLHRINGRVSVALSRAGENWCYRPDRTRLLCAVSGGLASELTTTFPCIEGQVRTVANGVDVSAFKPDPVSRVAVRARLGLKRDALVAIFVGGDWARKGLAYAVDALELAPQWHLLAAGPGDAREMRQRAERIGVSERLRLLGSVSDMPPLYAAADAFVLPTAYETFSLVTYEAAASELPLLVSRVSGVDELLRHGANGWFITRDAADVAARLQALEDDPCLMRQMARAAREAAMSMSWDKMVDRYSDAYRVVANAEP